MQRSDYRQLRTHQALRDAMQSAISKEPPTRTVLAAALEDAGMPSSMVDEHVDALAELAKQHRLGARRWHLLQEADKLTLTAIRRIRAEDSLLGELAHLDDEDDEDADAIAQAALGQRRDGIVRHGKPPSSDAYSPQRAPWSQ